MPGDGNRDTWRHCRKGTEPPACGVVYFQLAMLSALLDSFDLWHRAPNYTLYLFSLLMEVCTSASQLICLRTVTLCSLSVSTVLLNTSVSESSPLMARVLNKCTHNLNNYLQNFLVLLDYITLHKR